MYPSLTLSYEEDTTQRDGDRRRTFRVLNILDDSNREAVVQEISMSMPSERVMAIIEKFFMSLKMKIFF